MLIFRMNELSIMIIISEELHLIELLLLRHLLDAQILYGFGKDTI